MSALQPLDGTGVTNIAGYLPLAARAWPHRIAVAFPAGRDAAGRVAWSHLTFAQLDRESDRLASGLRKVGITRGMRTVVMVKPGIELFTLVFAVFKAGIVPVMVDPGMGVENLKKCLAEARPEAFIGVPIAHALRLLLGWGRGTVRINVTAGRRWFWGGSTLRDALVMGGEDPACIDPAEDELAAILFTSGGTGVPKGVEYVHKNFLAQIEAIRGMYDILPGEIDLPTFPLFALFNPALGSTSIIPEMDATRPARVNPLRLYEAVRDWGVSTMFGSPALLETVSRHAVAHGERLPTIRRVMSAGAPVPAPMMERFLPLLAEDAVVVTPYGATECLPVATLSSREILAETRHAADEGRGVCVGRPVPSVEVAILPCHDDPIPAWSEQLRLPAGEVGEITVKGPQVTRAYFGRDQATAAAKIRDPDGGIWHRMGDLGYLDEQGRLWFCGRKAHRVETGTERLLTIPCEAVFNQHPLVRRSALVAVRRGEAVEPGICVELEPGAAAGDALVGELEALGAAAPHTRSIQRFFVHPGFPVDVRHNAKIDRLALGRWASQQARG
ncbi:MAG: fatty acid CoA ligase family protein [Pseudomonadota bacterium]